MNAFTIGKASVSFKEGNVCTRESSARSLRERKRGKERETLAFFWASLCHAIALSLSIWPGEQYNLSYRRNRSKRKRKNEIARLSGNKIKPVRCCASWAMSSSSLSLSVLFLSHCLMVQGVASKGCARPCPPPLPPRISHTLLFFTLPPSPCARLTLASHWREPIYLPSQPCKSKLATISSILLRLGQAFSHSYLLTYLLTHSLTHS